MKSREQIRVFKPDQPEGWGLAIWRQMLYEVVGSLELIRRLWLRDFSVRYRQTLLGPLWAILLPSVAVATFVVLNQAGVLHTGTTDVPYPVFALVGLVVWQLFSGGISSCTGAIGNAGDFVTKVRFPWVALVLSSLLTPLLDFVIRLVLVVVFFAYYGTVPAPTALLFPLTLIPLLCLTIAAGLAVAILAAVVRDATHVVTFATGGLLFLTPVVYTPRAGSLLETLNNINPLTPLVTAPRDIVLLGEIAQPWAYGWASLFSVIVLLIAWRVFFLLQSLVAERL